jgi:Predicted transcriptional regulators
MEDFIPVNEADFEETASSGESHDDYVELVRSDMQDIDRVFDLAELFKIFGDSTRLRILSALLNHELCVCDISEVLEMNQSAISHQLRVLRTAGLIKVRRSGKSAFYSLDDDHVKKIIEMGFEHINEKK